MTTKSNKDKQTIWYHHDADGIIAAYLTHFAYPNAQLKSTKEFGDCSKAKDGDIMVDMKPKDPSKKLIVIDHHPGHPTSLSKRAYKLTFGDKPASVLCFEKFKDKIPKEEWWKVVIGARGDQQEEEVPYEVWETCPALLTRSSNMFYGRSINKMTTYPNPVFIRLSSAINALLRYEKHNEALNLIKDAKSPYDIVDNPDVLKQKTKLKNDMLKIMSNASQFNFGYLKVVFYESYKARVSGYVSSVVSPDIDALDPTTVIAINKVNGSLSMRGKLCNYYIGRLSGIKKLHMDGHGLACGGKYKGKPEELLDELRREFPR